MGTLGAMLNLTEIDQKGRYYTERDSSLMMRRPSLILNAELCGGGAY